MTTFTISLTQAQKEDLIALIWTSLKRDREHKDRRQTGWGTKTQVGLIACIHAILNQEP